MNKESIQEISKQIKPAIQELSNQLGVAAGKLWEVGIRKQMIDGIAFLSGSIIGAAIIITAIVWLYRKWEDLPKYDRDLITYGIVIVSLLLSGFIIPGFYHGLLHLFVPEWTLIQEVLGNIN